MTLSWPLRILNPRSRITPELNRFPKVIQGLTGPFAANWIVLIVCAAIWILAWRVEPSPQGLGTHRQLGLPACGFLTVTGLPCPSCGLTTSIAQLVRGSVGRALQAQPFGVVLAVSLMAASCLALFGLVMRKSWISMVGPGRLEKWQIGLLIVLISSWVYKMLTYAS